jgi:hypothetical protein
MISRPWDMTVLQAHLAGMSGATWVIGRVPAHGLPIALVRSAA